MVPTISIGDVIDIAAISFIIGVAAAVAVYEYVKWKNK